MRRRRESFCRLFSQMTDEQQDASRISASRRVLAQSSLAGRPLELSSPTKSLPILAAIVLMLAIYSYPTLKTATVTGSRTIPAGNSARH